MYLGYTTPTTVAPHMTLNGPPAMGRRGSLSTERSTTDRIPINVRVMRFEASSGPANEGKSSANQSPLKVIQCRLQDVQPLHKFLGVRPNGYKAT